jgi:hypothetical protein
VNRYAYAGNDPINAVDAEGTKKKAKKAAAAAVTLGTITVSAPRPTSPNPAPDGTVEATKLAMGLIPILTKAAPKAIPAAKNGVPSPAEVAATIARSRVANFSQTQLDKKFKHAADFGIVTTKKNPETLAKFEAALKSHIHDADTVQRGTYGYDSGSKVLFNPKTNNVVILDKADGFVTGFKLDPGTGQYANYIKNGFLR